jgi:hypothetical protein
MSPPLNFPCHKPKGPLRSFLVTNHYSGSFLV